ncbi:MAG: arylsulfatase [Sedimentisphaerales bacterium]|nr:arylsulfatase [Sedimentisphaerales bacterium]
MDRRQFIRGAGIGLALWHTTGCNSEFSKLGHPRKPNIVLIYTDDLGYCEVGCYGQKKIQTPNIDRLCAEGIKFTNHYSGSAVCAPARCCLMTGRHGGHAFVRDNYEVGGWETYNGQLPLPAETVTIASMLKNRGYKTAAFGKWGLGAMDSTGNPLNQGFDRFFGYNCQRHAHNLYPQYLIDDNEHRLLKENAPGQSPQQYAPQVIADEMLDWIRAHKDKPFFVYYPTVLPHLPLQVPQTYIDQYKNQWSETPYVGQSYVPHPTPRAAYAAMISFMDEQVGRILQKLKELGLDKDTVVFFSSDNGTTHLGPDQVDFEFFESVGQLRGLKGSLDEGGIRVPMIVRWPGKIKPGTVSDHISAQYDILATLGDLADIPVSSDTDSISFLPTLLSKESSQKQHAYLFWDFAGYGGQLAVRMGRWKGIKRNLKKNPNNPLELYDLENDISEQHNLAKEYPKVAQEIEEIMQTARTKPVIEQFQFGNYQDTNN